MNNCLNLYELPHIIKLERKAKTNIIYAFRCLETLKTFSLADPRYRSCCQALWKKYIFHYVIRCILSLWCHLLPIKLLPSFGTTWKLKERRWKQKHVGMSSNLLNQWFSKPVLNVHFSQRFVNVYLVQSKLSCFAYGFYVVQCYYLV